jgi:hypothetical protein
VRHLNGSFEGLDLDDEMGRCMRSVSQGGGGSETNLDTGGFVQLVCLHVHDVAGLAVNTPRMLTIHMFCLFKKRWGGVGGYAL